MKLPLSSFVVGVTVAVLSPLAGCSESSSESPSTGGSPSAGGSAGTTSGGTQSGGLGGLSGGVGTGGVSTGGLGTGGISTGGVSTGGVSTGGLGTGGATTGGAAAGGPATGGTATGGAVSGGAGGTISTCSAGFANVAGIGSGTGDNPAPTFATLKAVIESQVGCNGADCHFGSKSNALELKPDAGLHMRLLNTVSVKCMNLPVVTPCRPDQSALIKVLRGACGTVPRMPYDCKEEQDSCVPVDYIAAIEHWIANGAPEN